MNIFIGILIYLSLSQLVAVAQTVSLKDKCSHTTNLIDDFNQKSIKELKKISIPFCGFPINSPLKPRVINRKSKNIILKERTLLVVHAHSGYGVQARDGINSLTEASKSRNEPIIYMLENYNLKSWYPQETEIYHICEAIAGQHSFQVDTSELVVAGGLFGACLGEAVRLGIKSYLKKHTGTITIHLPMDSITTSGANKLLSSKLSGNKDHDKGVVKGLTENVIQYWNRESIGVSLFLDGNKIPQSSPKTNPPTRVQYKFWTSSEKFKSAIP